MKRIALTVFVASLLMNQVACARSDSEPAVQSTAAKGEITSLGDKVSMEQKDAALDTDMAPKAMLPAMTVYKSPTCGCCTLWVQHLEKAGFEVTEINTPQMSPIKQQFSVPAALGSCHTATVGGYFVEGHVPAADVKRLLQEKPDVFGIGVPGMPMGSPGMESPSGETQPYSVSQVNKDGSLSIFSSHSR
jgi:hypothetical protein